MMMMMMTTTTTMMHWQSETCLRAHFWLTVYGWSCNDFAQKRVCHALYAQSTRRLIMLIMRHR